MFFKETRVFGKTTEAVEIPELSRLQLISYERLLQSKRTVAERKTEGIEGLLQEIFPIVSYDENLRLEYLNYELGKPRYTPDECRYLRLTYGVPFRIRCRLIRKDKGEIMEDSVYLGEIPLMIGGGEFIVNGAERVIVNQLHRSPGVDFVIESQESDRPLHGCRIIPERGSWIEISVTKKEIIVVRIDQSSKLSATTFLRAMDERFSSTETIIREFHTTKKLAVDNLKAEMWSVGPIIDKETGEVLVKAGCQIGEVLPQIQNATIGSANSGAVPVELKGFLKKAKELVKKDNWFVGKGEAVSEPGVYLFRNHTEPNKPIVYVGMTAGKKTSKQSPRLSEHWGGNNVEGSSLRWHIWRDELAPDGDERTKVEVKKDKEAESSISEWMKEHLECVWLPVELENEKNWEIYANQLRTFFNKKSKTIPKKTIPKKKENPIPIVLGFLEDRLMVEFEDKKKHPDNEPVPFFNRKVPDDVDRIKGIWKRTGASAVSASSVEVVDKPTDQIIFNTLADDTTEDHESALLKIYARLRPGNPAKPDKAKILFKEKFYDANRYRLGRVGRFRLNRKFGQEIPEADMTLKPDDFLNSLKYLVGLRNGQGEIDDIDHLGNRRLRTIDELAIDELRKGFLKLRRSVQERMSIKDPEQLGRIAELVNSKSISSSIDFFFGRGELSQVVDQTNPLSQLTHERRLSALGPGGLNRKRAGFEVRDVHISHYGRICPIETPEGTNIGLISSLGIYSGVDEYGFLITPYRKIEGGKVVGVEYLRADQEIDAILAPTDALDVGGKKLRKGMVLARVGGDLSQVDSNEVQYVDVASRQTVGVSAALIPFLEHDDANRALMGSNMQRQAVPLMQTEPPVVGTGMEHIVARNSSMVVQARRAGEVTYVDSMRIVVNQADEYALRKFVGLNERTCLNQKPVVKVGQKVKVGDVIADGAATCEGELALGRNVLVGFMMFDGYNFEDAILISEKLVKDDVYTSIHIEEYEIEIRETKLGREEFTRDIPNVSEKALANLDEGGVVCVGTYIKPGDILVGKVSPKSKSELSPEEKLLYAIFGRAGEDVKNDSLEVPSGQEGIVIDTKRFSRRMYMSDEQRKAHNVSMKQYELEMSHKIAEVFRQMSQHISDLDLVVVDPATRQKMGVSDSDEVILEQVDSFNENWIKPAAKRKEAVELYTPFWDRIGELQEEKQRKLQQLKRGDELPSGVLEMVKVHIATKRRLSVGDKMAGRHGNKGVIARILPEEDMPFLEDGTPLGVLLNPLGVPSRMNVGQVLETHLGWAAKILDFQAISPVFDGAVEEDIHKVVEEANQKIRHHIGPEFTPKWLREHYLTRYEIKCVPFKKSERGDLKEEELGAIETLLFAEFMDKTRSDGKPLPKLNSVYKNLANAKERIRQDSELQAYLKLCISEAESTKGWLTIEDNDGRLVPGQVEELKGDQQGIYFLRDLKTKKVCDGYIGLGGATGKRRLKARIKMHFTGGLTADNLLKKWKEKAQEEGFIGNNVREKDIKHNPETIKSIQNAGETGEIFVEMPYGGKLKVYDGRTGEPFDMDIAVGYMYLMKLHHLVDDKIHARATGPYSLITQQPLGGKARTGGQRFGEMEVWGLEAYGTAYILQELLTVKSDDVEGRTKIYESMVKGLNCLEAGTPVSFDVLCNEIRGLGLNIQLEKKRVI